MHFARYLRHKTSMVT